MLKEMVWMRVSLQDSYQHSIVHLKLKTAETRGDKLWIGGGKRHCNPTQETTALSVQHPSIPCTDTYTIPCSLPLPLHC